MRRRRRVNMLAVVTTLIGALVVGIRARDGEGARATESARSRDAAPPVRDPAGREAMQRGTPLDSAPRVPVRKTAVCTVSRVVDGDTADCKESGRVRLIGIDAPESSQKPFGASAKTALAALLPLGARAQLELDVEPRDRYGRTLGYLWHEGKQVNYQMVRNGWAVVLTYPPNVQYVEQFRRAQAHARSEQRGLWKVDGFRCLPVEHRQKRC